MMVMQEEEVLQTSRTVTTLPQAAKRANAKHPHPPTQTQTARAKIPDQRADDAVIPEPLHQYPHLRERHSNLQHLLRVLWCLHRHHASALKHKINCVANY